LSNFIVARHLLIKKSRKREGGNKSGKEVFQE